MAVEIVLKNLSHKAPDIRRYVGVDVTTGEWVSGDELKILNSNDTVWIRRLKNNKRKSIETEYWIVPETLHAIGGTTEDGQPDYLPVDLSRYTGLTGKQVFEGNRRC